MPMTSSGLFGRRDLSRWVHAAAILALALTILVRFYPQLTSTWPRTDERVYLRAFAAASEGESPYAEAGGLDYYYPPPFAFLGAAALDLAGSQGVVVLMRLANVLGLAACLWIALLLSPLRRRWCLAVAAAYVCLAPVALRHGFNSGNLSFAVAGSSVVALTAWRHVPLLAGLLLGLSSITKPIAPLGLVSLAAHRPAAGGRRHLWAAGAGLAVAGVLGLVSPFLSEYLAVDGDVRAFPLRRSVSFYRWLDLLGLPVSPLVVVALVAIGTIWIARRSRISPRQLLILAITAMALATPAAWSHTLIFLMPLQVLALSRAWVRLKERGGRSVRYETALVVLGVAALQFADGLAGGVEARAASVQALVLAVGVFAPVGLALYAWSD